MMTPELIVQRLRRFLLMLAAFILVGTIAELWLTEHFEESLQLIPFVLAGFGLLVIGAVLVRPQRLSIWALRIVMTVVASGSLLGMYLHLANNFQFELEIRPNAGAGDVIMETLQGANPLLAPGVLALAAILAIAATYYHPALNSGEQA
jgi:hypothetical protein